MRGKIFIETEYERKCLPLNIGDEKDMWEKVAQLKNDLPTMTGNKYVIYCDLPSKMNKSNFQRNQLINI